MLNILKYFVIFCDTLEYSWTFWNIFEHFGIFLNVLDYSWIFGIFLIFLNILEYSGTFWNILEYSEIFCNIDRQRRTERFFSLVVLKFFNTELKTVVISNLSNLITVKKCFAKLVMKCDQNQFRVNTMDKASRDIRVGYS